MAPAVVLWAWWRRGGRDAGRRGMAFACAVVIALSYAVQLIGLAAGLVAARGFADPLAHVADFAALVAIIVAAEYAGHAAAVLLILPGTGRGTARLFGAWWRGGATGHQRRPPYADGNASLNRPSVAQGRATSPQAGRIAA